MEKATKICETCGKQIIRKSNHNYWNRIRFCSDSCRKKAKYIRHRDEVINKSKNYYEKNKENVLEYQKSRLEEMRKKDSKFKEKYNLRHNSCRKISLKDKSCELCGARNNLQRHHKNYRSSTDIKILCRKCHNKIHKDKTREESRNN